MPPSDYRILVTGSNGFIGKNLIARLGELPNISVSTFVRGDDKALLPRLLRHADAVVHLAGENRPVDDTAFSHVNAGLTETLCAALQHEYSNYGRRLPLLLASSIQAESDTSYGRSKLAAERAVAVLARTTDNPCVVFRFPGVFGKWSKPNYNSVVATFCFNLARGLPIQINDPDAIVKLVYIDDVINSLLNALKSPTRGYTFAVVEPEYTIALGKLAAQIRAFAECRTSLMSERVGKGLVRALYATYVSYLPREKFSYRVKPQTDQRGVFVEMLKTPDCGQFSYFTAHPGVTRGGHYHHTKSEKFLVINGDARFRFRHLVSGELVEFSTSGTTPEVVDTIPGWSHEITNVGNREMVVMLWANENFDPKNPDTVVAKPETLALLDSTPQTEPPTCVKVVTHDSPGY